MQDNVDFVLLHLQPHKLLLHVFAMDNNRVCQIVSSVRFRKFLLIAIKFMDRNYPDCAGRLTQPMENGFGPVSIQYLLEMHHLGIF